MRVRGKIHHPFWKGRAACGPMRPKRCGTAAAFGAATLAASQLFGRIDVVDKLVYEIAHAAGTHDTRILGAFRSVPRERFVPTALHSRAYEDVALPIGHDQTISQPSMVAIMLSELDCSPASRVLEIGSGSGYAAALLSRLANTVHGVERHYPLFVRARETLASLGCTNVTLEHGDGTSSAGLRPPFDRILVSAAAESVPLSLLAALAPGGRLVMPVGDSRQQVLITCTRDLKGNVDVSSSVKCVFVPLVAGAGVQV